MFVASYATLPPGSGFHLGVNVQIFPCNALYRVFAVTIKKWTVYYSARYHLGATSLRLGPFITIRGTASVPLGPSITMRGKASVPLGPSITVRGTASAPLGPSITMRGTASVPPRYRSGPLSQCAAPTPRLRL